MLISHKTNKTVIDRTDSAPGVVSGGVTLSTRHFLVAIYAGTLCHKYSTCPLRPILPWLQEVVPSVRGLQWVFLRAKPKAACEPHCLSLAAMSSSISLSIKPEIRNVSLRRQRRTEPRPWVTCTRNLVKIVGVVPKIWSRTDKHKQTDRHAHHNTPLPYRGRGIKVSPVNTKWGCI